MSGPVRKDIERSFQQQQPQPDVDISDVLAGAAVVGGGALLGRQFGKALLRARSKSRLGNDAMKWLNRGKDAGDLVPPDSFSRFRRKAPR